VGDRVARDSVLAVVHAASEDDWRRAEAEIRSAIGISEQECAALPSIHQRLKGGTQAP